MHGSGWRDAWNRFFFHPVPAYPLGLFRVAFASVVLVNIVLLFPDAAVWFSEQGTLPLEAALRYMPGLRVNVFQALPRSDFAVECFFGFFFLAAVLLLVGFQTRLASVLVWVCLASLHHRNASILQSGDTLMRNFSFFLMFAAADKAFSLDRYRRIRRGREAPGVPLVSPWPQRLIQIQLCVMYLTTVLWKLRGTTWIDGSAVYFTMQLDEFRRFPVPEFMHSLWFSMIATWATLAVELAMATLVWVRPLRSAVLICGVVLHLGIECTMVIPVFQWVVLSSYVLFLDPDALSRRFDPGGLRA